MTHKEKAAEFNPAELLSILEVAALLSCSPRTVTRLVDSGRIPSPVRIKPRWTKRETAAFYAVTERTIGRWLCDETLPAEAKSSLVVPFASEARCCWPASKMTFEIK